MTATSRAGRRAAIVATGVYLLLGSLWIFFTDRALLSLIENPETLTRLQTVKGWVFIVGSALLVYALVRGSLGAVARMERAGRRQAALLDAIPSRVAWRDRSGHYLGCNLPFARDVGLESHEAIRGLTDEELPRSLGSEGIEADLRQAETEGVPSVGRESVTGAPSGATRRLRYSVIPVLDADRGIEGTILCFDDVTEQAAQREQLRQAQKMNEIGQFTTGVAHDFNNVLSVIRANADLVAENDMGQAEILEAVGEIRTAAEGAHRMVSRLLGLARRAEAEVERTDVAALVGDVVPVLSRLLTSAYPVEYEVVGSPPRAMVDPRTVEQALMNLATNARDAMKGGGRIMVRVEAVELGSGSAAPTGGDPGNEGFWSPPSPLAVSPGTYVAVTVTDRGPGIDAEVLPSIFKPFFTTKERGAGTGLGLPMVQGLMEQQGGAVQVRSRPGEGTTMRLLLPASEDGEGAEPAGDSPAETIVAAPDSVVAAPDSIVAAPVLIVDDQPELRRTLGRVLRRYGWAVVEASDGVEALELFESDERFSLVLSDLTMPRMGGLELYRALRERGVDVPFAVTSGMSELEAVARSDEEGALPFLPKPWTVPELLEAVRAWTSTGGLGPGESRPD